MKKATIDYSTARHNINSRANSLETETKPNPTSKGQRTSRNELHFTKINTKLNHQIT
jgi:hypothetical protein